MTRRAAPSLLVDISAHGYGHIAQTAPVVNALARRVPGLRVTVRSAAPAEVLRPRFQCAFEHLPVALDFGMKMVNAVEVQVEESAAAYRTYHAGWEAKVQREAAQLRALRPDLVLANVPYISLAAAHAAGIPAVAMCCLNWADIYHHYCASAPEADDIRAQILAAYAQAEVFLKVQPAMPMPDLRNTRLIGPIAEVGRNRRAEIDARLGLAKGDKLVLVAMGGMAYRLPVEGWPRIPGVRWLIPAGWHVARPDMMAFEALDLSFSDVFASVDAVLTKPGYGAFAEAACAGVPALYVSRGDWPEQRYLVAWLEQHGVCRELSRDELLCGDLAGPLAALWSRPRPPIPRADGAEQAADVLADVLAVR